MNVKEERFIVLSLGDTDSWGYNEHTLPMLIQLVDEYNPDARFFSRTGVVGYFFTSQSALKRVEEIVENAEKLRKEDERFSTLGIGVAEGKMLAEYEQSGILKQGSMMPIGDASVHAVRMSDKSGNYKESLSSLNKLFSIETSRSK
jgi:hypothetical protein